MTKLKTHQGGNGENTKNTESLITDAFERPETDGGNTSGGDKKVPTTIKEEVGKTGEEVVRIIKDL